MDVSEDGQWLHTFGVEPQTEVASGDDFVRELVLTSDDGNKVHLTWDVVAGSLRVRWQTGDSLTVDVYREGVHRLRVDDSTPGCSGIRADYRHDDVTATLLVQVWPSFRLCDAPLHLGRHG